MAGTQRALTLVETPNKTLSLCLRRVRSRMHAVTRTSSLSSSSSSSSSLPVSLVLVVGSTGAGKSQLAHAVARATSARLLNCDAMQMYSGFDVATNKASEQERVGLAYGMLGTLPATRLHYRVSDFVNDAVPQLEADAAASGSSLAIAVGGTNCYVEALLWRSLIGATDVHGDQVDTLDAALSPDDARLLQMAPAERFAELARVDPTMASKLHANDERRVLRSLQIFHRTGVRQSALLVGAESSQHSGALRFARTCVLWVDCDQDVLDARTDARVDRMLRDGLLDELVQLRQTLQHAEAALPDAQRVALGDIRFPFGVAQAIGYKEFADCFAFLDALSPDDLAATLAAIRSGAAAQLPAALTHDRRLALDNAVLQIKTNTRRYARAQRKWIRKRFVATDDDGGGGVPDSGDRAVYRFDSSDAAAFESQAVPLAVDVVRAFLARSGSPLAPIGVLPRLTPSSAERVRGWSKHVCDVCNRQVNGDAEWQAHVKSKAHRNAARAKSSGDV